MFAPSDERLVKRAIAQHKHAWLQLVRRYEGLVYNYALRMTGQRADALDVMQDVFLSVYRSLHRWRGESSFKTWLMIIAHHRCVEFFRRQRQQYDNDDELTTLASDDVWDSPEAVYAGQQQGQQLVRAMQQLPIEQRLIVELKFFQHLSLQEIAEQLHTPLNTVKSRFYKAVERLQKLVEGA